MRARPSIALLHSPLVGPGSWAKVGVLLRDAGYDVVMPDLLPAFQLDPPFYPRLAQIACGAVGDREAVALVVHSGAGALVPAIAECAGPIDTVIFADALLPHPGRSWFSTVPEKLAQHLRSLACDGRLPRWHEWWPRDAIRTLVGAEAVYESFVAALPEVPLAYFEELAPAAEIPSRLRCAYLQLSAACKPDADEAEARSWTVWRDDLNHLAMLTHSDIVAARVEELVRAQ